jgi:hypothetical protein
MPLVITPTPYLLLADDADLKPGATPFIFSFAVKLNLPTSLRNVMALNAYYGPIAAFQDIQVFITTADHTNVKFRIHIGTTVQTPFTSALISDFTPSQNIVNNTTYVLAFQRTSAGTAINFSINGSIVSAPAVGVNDTLVNSIPAGRSICLGIPPSSVITGANALPDNPTATGSAIFDDVFVQLLSNAGNTFKYRLRTSTFID